MYGAPVTRFVTSTTLSGPADSTPYGASIVAHELGACTSAPASVPLRCTGTGVPVVWNSSHAGYDTGASGASDGIASLSNACGEKPQLATTIQSQASRTFGSPYDADLDGVAHMQ